MSETGERTARIFSRLSLPDPHSSSMSTQAATAPGTVAPLMSSFGIRFPSIPLARTFSSVKALGDRPEPLIALTILVLAS